MSRLIIIATCAALALSLAACGDDKKSDGAASAPAAPEQTSVPTDAADAGAVVSVGIKNIKFVPDRTTVKVGQKITWTNNEAIVHNVTATDGADFASDSLGEDDTFEYTPKQAGTISYVCTIHSGQNGSITVTE